MSVMATKTIPPITERQYGTLYAALNAQRNHALDMAGRDDSGFWAGYADRCEELLEWAQKHVPVTFDEQV